MKHKSVIDRCSGTYNVPRFFTGPRFGEIWRAVDRSQSRKFSPAVKSYGIAQMLGARLLRGLVRLSLSTAVGAATGCWI